MDGIFFLILAFFTVLVSIKLSNYADALSKQSKLGSMFVGGLLIASITSLPELVTSISACIINSPNLSFGDILGSNFFNIFILATLNVIFFRKLFIKNIQRKYIIECLILLMDYIIIYLSCNNILTNFTSIILSIFYLIYLLTIINRKEDDENNNINKVNHIFLKFILSGVIMVFLSILLTLKADNISSMYPNFSSSTIGAILLGITTSLPEVVTTFELIRLNNYNMAISNMLGSNIFNFLVLSISDYLFKSGHIYLFGDKYSYYYLYGGVIITFLLLLQILFKSKKNIFYIIVSSLIIIIYFYIWYLQFV